MKSKALPKDAALVELRSDALTFATRKCLLPGTLVSLVLVMEGQPLRLEIASSACLVVDKDWRGYLYHCRLSLDSVPEPDRKLIELFIGKGRGAPNLLPPMER